MERSDLLLETWLEQTSNHFSEWKLSQSFWIIRYCTIRVGSCACLPPKHILLAICQIWYGWMKIFTDKWLHSCFFRFGLMQLHRSSSLWAQALVFSWPLPATIPFITTATSTRGSHSYLFCYQLQGSVITNFSLKCEFYSPCTIFIPLTYFPLGLKFAFFFSQFYYLHHMLLFEENPDSEYYTLGHSHRTCFWG